MTAVTEVIQTTNMPAAVVLLVERGFWRVKRSSLEWMSNDKWARIERLPSGRVNVKIGIQG